MRCLVHGVVRIAHREVTISVLVECGRLGDANLSLPRMHLLGIIKGHDFAVTHLI